MSAAAGAVAGAAVVQVTPWSVAILTGWDVAALVFLAIQWRHLVTCNGPATLRHARADDPGRALTELIVVAAGVVLLADVALILVRAGHVRGTHRALLVALGIVSVVLSWATVHTVFTFRYARAYVAGPGQDPAAGAVDFNEDDATPDYRDFAYLAFTVGMTFQVSDTDLRTKLVRRTALGHALISYLFGAVIVAMSINLVASLLQ